MKCKTIEVSLKNYKWLCEHKNENETLNDVIKKLLDYHEKYKTED